MNIGKIEKEYGVDFGVRSDMKLDNYLKKEGLAFMSKAVKNIKKKIKEEIDERKLADFKLMLLLGMKNSSKIINYFKKNEDRRKN